jgi:GNAT superfamily N-acetyltransferase
MDELHFEIVKSEDGCLTTILAHTRTQRKIGWLQLFRDGTVEDVTVDERHQRRGVATALWNYAIECGYKPKHSADRTTEGDSWAKSVGGYLPPLTED